ncbi:hypothetical protein, partial [Hydrotalea sp.]|uniref:hypothetical protein n=1 Tax=Hydrotalea sp. TaxID=2881279 RepID=UPI003D10C25C
KNMTAIFSEVLRCSFGTTVVNCFSTLFYILRRNVNDESNVSYSAHLMQVGSSLFDGALIFLSLFVSKQKVKKISLRNVNTLASANPTSFKNTAAYPKRKKAAHTALCSVIGNAKAKQFITLTPQSLH